MSLMEASVSESGNMGLKKDKHGSFLYTAGTEVSPSHTNSGTVGTFSDSIPLFFCISILIYITSHLCNSESNMGGVIIHPLVQSD